MPFFVKVFLIVGLALLGALVGGYVGSEIRASRDYAAGVSWEEPVFTELEVGGFLAGGALGGAACLGLLLRARRQGAKS